ncbi:hypothetical protein DTO282E5_6314 [Paecilomyces variotii]|nr:hypothetical protein DTO282E5_6314 [Paecilomyces variotii]
MSEKDMNPSPSDSDGSTAVPWQQEMDAIGQVASRIHDRMGSVSVAGDGSADPRLDPTNPEFDHYLWAHTALKSLHEAGIKSMGQGVAFSNLCVSGSGAILQFQDTVLSALTKPLYLLTRVLSGKRSHTRRRILHGFDGLLESGELLLVLGRPGSGCSTLLRTICGHVENLVLEPESSIQYQGIDYKTMIKHHRGNIAYNQEVDKHFPHLTVGETLSFAAHARTPQTRVQNMSRESYVDTIVQVTMAAFGLSHTYNTKVGDDFVRGVSGGERKRVSIAEMFLSRSRIAAWDNSTRGLDAASALRFVKALRLSADLGRSCHAVAAYQASQAMYDLFDKVVVLYEGREIYFGPADRAVDYFEEMGWEKPLRQVSGDFLTAITNPRERRARQGMEEKVPRTPTEFAEYWERSTERQQLLKEVNEWKTAHPPNNEEMHEFQAVHESQQSRHTRSASPYLISVPMQIRLCMKRAYQRLRNDLPTTLSTVIVQFVLSLIIGSIFYNSPNSSSAFFQKGAVIFFAVLMNALITINEILVLYSQRPIVEKQAAYAFVHPFTEALASIIVDLPVKVFRCSIFTVVLYFMANLRREPSQFFIFYLFLITAIITMSGIFRSLGAITKAIGQAMTLAGILVICIVVYTGFTLPQTYMHPWFSWIRWINPIFYTFEALVSNEFHGRQFECGAFVPSYGTGNSFICSSVGAVVGERFVSGDSFIEHNYGYSYSHVWRNYGILIGFLIFFNSFYLLVTEYNTGSGSKGETLVFRPGHAPRQLESQDVENPGRINAPEPDQTASHDGIHLSEQKDIFSWRGVKYEIPTKDGTRRLLDEVDGWVKPGTLTALMGVSGAGKTTLLDVLAQRVSFGVITGKMLVNGRELSANFPRRTGYVQQQDLHLETATVREALRFSAVLRQPKSVSTKDKYQYVEQVIDMLGMADFAEAVVGIVGEGLNVEQRKLLSIGVELAAKPSLLIFLDEPTSGLDSQSSWTICALLRKLADNGQAVLATIHQPSALLFQQFDRLLLLAKGGKTVYFGDLGDQSNLLLEYFSRNGARPCEDLENPAEYMLQVLADETKDWSQVWKNSPEYREVLAELDRLEHSPVEHSATEAVSGDNENDEFAMPLAHQFYHVLRRVFQQYFRQPQYILSRCGLGIIVGIFIGFSFWKADNSVQGFQNSLFSIFLLCTIFSTLVNQIMPKFVSQRALYEVRERPSRVYSWKVFILSQIMAELPWQILVGICSWAAFYFPVFGANQSSQRQGLILLFVVQFWIYAASMAIFVVAAIPEPAVASMLAILMFGLSFIFNGVMQPPTALPGFWIFMYRVSPFTYYISGMSSTALHARPVQCSDRELSVLDPPPNQTCGQYLETYVKAAGGQLYNPDSTSGCQYCALTSADQYLAAREIYWGDRWRNYGIFWAYFVFNICGAVILYYIFRVRTWKKK